MSIPFIHPDRHDTPGAAIDAFPDELPLLWEQGVRAVVCLLNMPGAARTYAAAGFAFHLMPVADGDAPSMEAFGRFLTFVSEQCDLNHPVAVHCEAGLGRTGTVLAGYLISACRSAAAAIEYVRTVRPGAIETVRQVEFLQQLSASFKSSAERAHGRSAE
jgi:protein-tyrosine phosphatase